MLEKLLIKQTINNLAHREQHKKNKLKKRSEKKNHKEQMIKLFGSARYYLSYWFGTWVLYTCNHRQYGEPEKVYQKFYNDERVVMRYAKKLEEKYTIVSYDKVFDRHKKQIGYMLYGKQKKIADSTQQPSNIISFDKYKTKLAR